MKRVIMSMLLAVAVAGISFAQEPQANPAKTQPTEEQKAKLRQEALDEYKAKVIAEARERDAKARAARVKKVAEDAPADGMLDLFGE